MNVNWNPLGTKIKPIVDTLGKIADPKPLVWRTTRCEWVGCKGASNLGVVGGVQDVVVTSLGVYHVLDGFHDATLACLRQLWVGGDFA